MLKRKSRLSKQKRRKLLECFAADLSATQTAKVLGLNRDTVNLWYRNFHEQILEQISKKPRVTLGISRYPKNRVQKTEGNPRDFQISKKPRVTLGISNNHKGAILEELKPYSKY